MAKPNLCTEKMFGKMYLKCDMVHQYCSIALICVMRVAQDRLVIIINVLFGLPNFKEISYTDTGVCEHCLDI